jgi:hypothetical protein
VILIPIFGSISDSVGHAKIYVLASLFTGCLGFAYLLLPHFNAPELTFATIALSGLAYAMLAGPQAAMVAGAFRMPRRYSGSSLGTQLGALLVLIAVQALMPIFRGETVWLATYLVLLCSFMSALAAIALRGNRLAAHVSVDDVFTTIREMRSGTVFRLDNLKTAGNASLSEVRDLVSVLSGMLKGKDRAEPGTPEARSAAESMTESASPSETSRRSLNAWIDDAAPRPGRPFHLRINIGAAVGGEAGSVVFVEPDWHGVDRIDLIVAVASAKCIVEPAWRELSLERTGDSEMLDFVVTALVPGDHDFTVRVYLAKQMVRLQSLSFSVVVAELVA